jgi:glycosyltransferase involved in cell wall biosynthesis
MSAAPVRQVHQTIRVAITFKNFAANKGISHIGLGVSATQNAKALRSAGYIAELWPILTVQDLAQNLAADRATASIAHHIPVTHVVISAPWIATADLSKLVFDYPDTEFVVVSHSNIGFLQADPRAIELLRQGSELEQAAPNFHIAGNSPKFRTWWQATYQTRLLLLPNMYPFDSIRQKPQWSGGRLRIGCFCAIRPYKNVLTAAAAALEVGVRLRSTDLEFWISGGRTEGGGGTITNAIHQMYKNMPRAKVVENTWQSWPSFVATVGSMDLLLQPSYTEGFNMVTADGISRGVASVVGEAIGWAPSNWIASTDAASDIANKAVALLHDPSAAEEGVEALIRNNDNALNHWKKFLTLHP